MALENYTMAAATELGRRGVTANMIHPPITDSGWVNDSVREFAATSSITSTSPIPPRSPESSHGCAQTKREWSPAT